MNVTEYKTKMEFDLGIYNQYIFSIIKLSIDLRISDV